MEGRIIEAEEYAPGRFREPRWKLGHQYRKVRKDRRSKEHSSSSPWSTVDVVIIDSCISAISIGLVIRFGVVIYYILSCHKVTYDMDISLFGLIAKFFWIWLDSTILKAWFKHVHPKISRSDSRVAVLIPILIRGACCFISGYAIHQIVVGHRLSFFFAINKPMVMGGMALVGLVLIHRISRLTREFMNQKV